APRGGSRGIAPAARLRRALRAPARRRRRTRRVGPPPERPAIPDRYPPPNRAAQWPRGAPRGHSGRDHRWHLAPRRRSAQGWRPHATATQNDRPSWPNPRGGRPRRAPAAWLSIQQYLHYRNTVIAESSPRAAGDCARGGHATVVGSARTNDLHRTCQGAAALRGVAQHRTEHGHGLGLGLGQRESFAPLAEDVACAADDSQHITLTRSARSI